MDSNTAFATLVNVGTLTQLILPTDMETKYLTTLRSDMEDIAGQWNGDNPGLAEDRAHAATEAIEHIDALVELLAELYEITAPEEVTPRTCSD
jgi:hypothetical protein